MSPKKKDKPKQEGFHRDASPVHNPSERGLDNKRNLRGLEGPRR